ncbi:MAG: cytochrome c3 family protein [Planctomycetota bacterium]
MLQPFFPKWSNLLRPALGLAGIITPVYAIIILNFGFTPKTTDVGYEPEQPLAYSHAVHAGELGLNCEYCHFTVTRPGVGHSAVPPTETCMNCHHQIKRGSTTGPEVDSPQIAAVIHSYETGKPIEWVRVHDLPDYAFFNHSAHVNVRASADKTGADGVAIGCESCHGAIDTMPHVYQAKELSMSWCLDCHRRPYDHLRPASELTNMHYFADLAKAHAEGKGKSQQEIGKELQERWSIAPSQDCSTCHR